MNGYLLIDKPTGISSFKALTIARDALSKDSGVPFKSIKMGHAGTLDPLANGLLLVGVGQGTKMMPYLLTSHKKYIANIVLGKISDTGDEEGEKSDAMNRSDTPTAEEISAVCQQFIGKIEQTPPVYSALKINGKRACDRVRNGEVVEIKPRIIDIFSIEVVEYRFPLLQITVHCSSGTYIRTLAEDIGKKLNTGGYLTGLNRTAIGDFFSGDHSVSPDRVTHKDLLPFQPQHFNLPLVHVSEATWKRLQHGKKVNDKELLAANHEMLFFVLDNEIVGMGEQRGTVLVPRKIFA